MSVKHLTYTAKTQTPLTSTASFETSTNTNFTNYFRTSFDLVDHTDAGTTYTHVQHLNGGVNGRVGVGKSISVLPGDKVSIGAWAKYMNPGSTSNTTSFITALASAFGTSSTATGELGKLYSGLNSYATAVPGGDHPDDDETAPKAFVTILLFDKDYNLMDAAWKQITTVGLQSSPTVKQPPHDYLFKEVTVREPGYAYVFVSNEHPTYVDVYFDDITVTHTPSPIVSSSDYFAFGLQHTTGERAGVYEQRYLYNGKELQDELNIGWLDYGARMYMPEIGRWNAVDPLAAKFTIVSPYTYALNNPLIFIDPNGKEVINAYAGDYNKAKSRFDAAKADVGDKKRKTWTKEQKTEYRESKKEFNDIKSKYISAEKAIQDLKNTDGEFFTALDNLTDAGGNKVDIYVEVATSEQQAKQDGKQIYGTTHASPNNENNLALTQNHNGQPYYIPYSSYGKGTIKVVVPASGYGTNAPGRMLAHEGGHAQYLAHNLFYYYRVYLENNPYGPNDFEIGHRPGDPNGEAARAAERRYDERKKELSKSKKDQ
ncbi:MAG: hypothetical protein HRU69_07350 [Flammeovirgaceae bacterium]|nr:MAG: hypothetical protein HRU69_07350 [Flammeovirgaceae bacterium]